jgi:hypothetical protein
MFSPPKNFNIKHDYPVLILLFITTFGICINPIIMGFIEQTWLKFVILLLVVILVYALILLTISNAVQHAVTQSKKQPPDTSTVFNVSTDSDITESNYGFGDFNIVK